MRLWLWLRFAGRDLRSGLQGFWVFLTCLALGTATIAIVGSLTAAVDRGLTEQGQPLLGGDVEFALVHREASEAERRFMESRGELSKIATLRAMAIAGEAATLVEIKAVDDAYPLYGALSLTDGSDFRPRLAPQGDRYGALADPLLIGRLGIAVGGQVRLGNIEVEIRGLIASEPDRVSDGIVLGPRLLIDAQTLTATGLVQPGSLVTWRYRLKLPAGATLKEARQALRAAETEFPDAGWRMRTRDNPAQGADRYVERLGYFMTLVGLASLIVGGAGIANAVTAFVSRRTGTIAIFKCVGAANRDVFGIYLVEILLVALLAIGLGLAAGAAAPAIAGATLGDYLPLPIAQRIEIVPLAISGILGLLVTLAFALWPLAHTRRVPASALFRHRIAEPRGRPEPADLIAIILTLAAIGAVAFASFPETRITAWFLGGLAASFVALLVLARLIVAAARRLPRPGSAVWRYAIANLHRPGSAAVSVIMALGLGLTLFVTLALTDQTISRELRAGIPAEAPAFFFLDVRKDDLPGFVDKLQQQPGVRGIGSAPMLRGRMVAVKGVPVARVAADPDAQWALRGDRGLTYAETLPEGSRLVEGAWWPRDYSGPPLVSMVDEIANGIGVKIGDEITVNVLGRDITARVANLRQVNWRSLGINFVMVFSPNTLATAPHSHIVTVEMEGGDEAQLLNAMARAFPSVTAVRVKDAIAIVSDLLGKMLNGVRGANGLTLFTGVMVLAGALAAGLSERIYDAAVLKTYGATRRQLMTAFVIEYAALGLASAAFGIVVGTAGSWFLAHWILELPWGFSLTTAALTALIAMAVTVLAGLAATWRALSARPWALLRNE